MSTNQNPEANLKTKLQAVMTSTALSSGGAFAGWGLLPFGPRPVFAPDAEGAGAGGEGGGEAGAGDVKPGNEAGTDDGAGGEAGDDKGGEGGAGAAELTPEQKAEARKKELEAMSPEDREKAEAADAAAEVANTVPEDGKYTLSMPEGVTLNEALLAEVSPVFKDLGLTNGEAQALTDKFVAHEKAKGEAAVKRWGETVAGWAETASKDKEMGGDKWDATKANAQKAVDKLGTPELKKYMDETGGGNHPEVIRIFAKFGAMISDDTPGDDEPDVQGGKKPEKDAASILYPNDPPPK